MVWSNVFAYDNGNLIWKIKPSRQYNVGDIAGSVYNTGYVRVKLKGKRFMAHRIVWELHNGEIPKGYMIDHINGDKTDNRIENLRIATRAQNASNTLAKNYYVTRNGKYQVDVKCGGKHHYYGTYADKDEAIAVANYARDLHYKEFNSRREA